MNRFIAVLLLLSSTVVMAAPPVPPPPPPPPGNTVQDVPPPPPPIQSGQVIEPGVTIIQTENETIYEYRAGSQLYMVRVVPVAGPPYYFYDQNGDGELDYQTQDPRDPRINQWVLFRW